MPTCFVLQKYFRLAPHRGEDAAVESGFLPDVLARFFDGAPGTGRQVLDLERLEHEQRGLRVIRQGVTGFVRHVAAHTAP